MRCHILIRYKVKDYNYWQKEFNETYDWRKSQGEISLQIFRDNDDPHQVTILFEWKNLESAKKFIEDPTLSETMQQAGIIDQPTIYFLKKDL